MKILGTGLNGLVGTRIVELLSDRYTFENISRSTGTDITNSTQVEEAIKNSHAEIILHLAATSNVDECEKDKGSQEHGSSWDVNVNGTKNIAEACRKYHKKMIYLSTDYVFNGEKEGAFTEEDNPSPINWYGMTKFEGENHIIEADVSFIIARIATPYAARGVKKDFVRAMLGRLQEGGDLTAITDHTHTPTYLDDIAFALDTLMQTQSTGIYHVVGSESLTPYDEALMIAKAFGYEASRVHKTTRAEFFKDRAPRPYKLPMKHDKISALGIEMKTFKEGLEEIRKQV